MPEIKNLTDKNGNLVYPVTKDDAITMSNANEGKTLKETMSTMQSQKSNGGLLTSSQSIEGAINELFTSVSNGKKLIADAITDKGFQSSARDPFKDLADKIGMIKPQESNTNKIYGNIILSKNSASINSKTTDFINVTLDARPTNTQIINILPNDSTVIVSPSTLVFNGSNYNTPQSVVISTISNDFDDKNVIITFSSLNVPSVNATVTVNNSSLVSYGNIVLNKTSITLDTGSSDTFTVKLDKAPTNNQVVTLTKDTENITLSGNTLTFTPNNYNIEQEVTVTSNNIATLASITLSSPNVMSKSVGVVVRNTEQLPDIPSGSDPNKTTILIADENVSIAEGNYYTLQYEFSKATGVNTTLYITCDDSSVNLYPSNELIGESDLYPHYLTINPTTSSKANGRTVNITFEGEGFNTKTLPITITNNNASGGGSEGEGGTVEPSYGTIVLNTESISVSSSNTTATIGVNLASAPNVNQLVSISSNSNDINLSTTGLTFTPNNYSTIQSVTISLKSTATQSGSAVLTFSSNGDGNTKTVSVTITVNQIIDTPTDSYGQIILDKTILSINEGNSGSFSVKLDSAPTNNQTVLVSVASSSVASVYPTSLTFTKFNYSSPQSITVNGIHDYSSYEDKNTQINISSSNVATKNIYVTVLNVDQQQSGGDSSEGSGDGIDDSDVLPLEDNQVRNLVPYLSTYYIKPTVKVGEEVILNYFVTDYYGRGYTINSNFYNYRIIVRREGKAPIVATNVTPGDHSISLGSYDKEGIYKFSIIARDQYGRYSHELFNYVRVKNSTVKTNPYTVTASDLTQYGITPNNDKEERQYVPVSVSFSTIENDEQASQVKSAIDSAYNSASVSSGKYKTFVPMFGESSGTNYKGKTRGWRALKVKKAADFNDNAFKTQCEANRDGIQRLLNDKANAGYDKIIMHNATYVIEGSDSSKAIEIPNGIDLDLNGSTIKMRPITGHGALLIRMTDTTDTHLHNGTIEGDYFAHDYAGSEYNSEWVSGVEMGGSCRYSSIYDLEIKNITGYGLQSSISSTSPNGNGFFNPVQVGDIESGDIDRTTGENKACSYRMRSKELVNISAYQGNSEYISASIHLMYQGNEFSSWNYVMYFYNSSRQLIKAVDAYQYRQVRIPEGAYYARIVILGTRLKTNYVLHYQFFRVPTHCEYRNIRIDNARCVGMAQGQMKDFLVQDCIITNSGQSSATCEYDAEDGWDGMQDAFFENFQLTDCPANGFLTCAGHNFCINNMTSDGIYMWERSRWMLIKNSNFVSAIIRGGGEKNVLQQGITRFYNNTVTGMTYQLYTMSNLAKNCTYSNQLQSGILVNSTVGGNTVDKTIYNNDVNNPATDDYGKTSGNIDNGEISGSGSSNVPVSSVSLNSTSLNINVNETKQLVATINPSNASNQNVIWTSSNPTIATVSSTGLVTGKSVGYATITVKTEDGNKTATCSLTVAASSSGGITSNYTLTVGSNQSCLQGDMVSITYSISPSIPSGTYPSWELRQNNEYLCSAYTGANNQIVCYTGSLTANIYQNMTLVAKVYNNSNYEVLAQSNTFTLTVTSTSTPGGSTGGGGGSTEDGLVAIQYPATKRTNPGTWVAFGDSITYGFGVGGNDNAYPAKVASSTGIRVTNSGESGRVVATGASGATVPDSRSFCNYYTSLADADMLTVFGGVNDFLLGVSIGSTSDSGTTTFYGALNKLVAGVKSKYSGKRIIFFTPIKIGGWNTANKAGFTLKDYRNAIVTVCNSNQIEVLDLFSLSSMDAEQSVSNYMGTWDTTHPNGSGHMAIANYFIAQALNGSGGTTETTTPVTGITVSPTTVTLQSGGTQQLSFTITPTNATNKNVTWTTNNSSVATVNTSGMVTYVSKGTAIITATTIDGSYSASCTVTCEGQTSGGGSTTQDTFTDKHGHVLVTVKYPATPKANPSLWNALGDSITYGAGVDGNSNAYPAKAASKITGLTVSNYGISGTCVSTGYQMGLINQPTSTAMSIRYGQMGSADLITVFGGVNDLGGDVAIGNESDTGTATFYGALNTLVAGLKSKYPNGRIVFITPFKTGNWNVNNATRAYLYDFRNAIVTVCNKNQLEVIDLYTDENLAFYNAATTNYFVAYDYYHPTIQGHQYIADVLVKALFNGSTSSGGSGDEGGGDVTPPSGEATLDKTTVDVPFGSTGKVTVSGTTANISSAYCSMGYAYISYYDSKSVTLGASQSGKDTLRIYLSDGTQLSCAVNVGSYAGSGGDSGGSGDTAVNPSLSPSSATVAVDGSVTFTLIDGGDITISTAYVSAGYATVTSTRSTTVTVMGVNTGIDYLNIVLSNGNSLTATVTVTGGSSSSGGGSTGGGSGSGGGSTGGTGETEFVDGLAVVKYPATNKPNPKYWAALGDSITAGTGAGGSSYAYCAVAGKAIGCQVANYGIPGSCINDGYNTALTEPGYDQAFVNRYDEMGTGYDLITVLGSVNDHRADSKIGTEGSTDSRDFYGALYVLINGLKQRYPNARIVFITPFKTADWKGTNLYGHTMQDFRNAIVVMCNKYQIEVLDLFTVSQFEWLKGLLNSPSYFYQYDYYHPTPDGHIAIGNYLVQHMFNGSSGDGGGGGSSSGGGTTTPTVTYGNIITSSSIIYVNAGSSTTLSIHLDKAPTNPQTLTISTSGNVTVTTTSLTFTSSNYSTNQSITIYGNNAGSGIVTITSSNVPAVRVNVTINSTSSGSGGSSGSGSGSTSGGIANASDTALTQQYSSSHEATPNNPNPPAGAYNWVDRPRINPDGSFPQSTWNAIGHWMTCYKVAGSNYYDNVGLLLQDPKAWIWNTQTQQWDVLSSDFEWGTWYREDFWDDGSGNISGTTTWEMGVSGNHSTWVKIKQTSETSGRCFHPWGYQKNWRSNSAWSNNGQPYIVTKIDFKLVKYDESGADNLDNARLVVNSGADWWSEVGAVWQPDWSTNRDMAVGKYILATRELKRAWCTNLPQNWSHGLPSDTPRN